MQSIIYFSDYGHGIYTVDALVNGILQQVTTSSDSEIVYGTDENGNQVILGVILKGSPNEAECEYLDGILQENDEDENNDLDWVAAEEECVSSQDLNCEVKRENDVEECEEYPIRVYQVDKSVRKTLKKLQIEIKKKKQERKKMIGNNIKGKSIKVEGRGKKISGRMRIKVDKKTTSACSSVMHPVSFPGKCLSGTSQKKSNILCEILYFS